MGWGVLCGLLHGGARLCVAHGHAQADTAAADVRDGRSCTCAVAAEVRGTCGSGQQTSRREEWRGGTAGDSVAATARAGGGAADQWQ